MQPPRRCTTQFRCLELGVPRNALRSTDLRVSIPPTGRPPAGSPLFSSTGWVGLHLSSPDTRTQITRRADQRFNGGGGIVCELRVLHRRIVSRSLPPSDVRLWRCRSREVVSGSAIRVTEPEGDVLLTDREHLLSRLTPHSEHLDRAASTAHLRLATLADLARHRRGFGLRDFPRAGDRERTPLARGSSFGRRTAKACHKTRCSGSALTHGTIDCPTCLVSDIRQNLVFVMHDYPKFQRSEHPVAEIAVFRPKLGLDVGSATSKRAGKQALRRVGRTIRPSSSASWAFWSIDSARS